MYSCEQERSMGIAEYSILSKTPVPFINDIVKYKLINYSPDLTEAEHFYLLDKVFDEANFRLWPLRTEATTDEKEAYFKIHFVSANGWVMDGKKKLVKCPYKFLSSTLAVQYANYGGKYSGHCYVNDKFLFTLYSKQGAYSIIKILKHEIIGHGFGLDHSELPGELMNSIYNENNELTIDTDLGLWSLYSETRLRALRRNETARLLYTAVSGGNEVLKNPVIVRRHHRIIEM